jgi:molecular chaperone DnaK
VIFDIDANGILTVTAKDKKTGKEANIEIQSSGGLNADEIESMRKSAEENAAEDAKQVELIEATNKLDSEIYQIEKMVNENKDKLPEHIVTQFEGILQEATEAKDSQDLSRMKDASEKLMQMTQNLQQAAQAAGPTPGAAEAVQSDGDDDIIDITPE